MSLRVEASGEEVDATLLARIRDALVTLPIRRPSLLNRLRFSIGRRYKHAAGANTETEISGYLREEANEFAERPDKFNARFILEAPDQGGALSCCIRLSATVLGGAPSAYGCSAIRVGDDAYVLDLHSPVFGLNASKRLTL